MAVEREILFNISKLKNISVMKLANETGISQANLSRWFKNQKGGYVKEEKIERMATYLGVNYKSGKLFPGIHRWNGVESGTSENFIKSINALSPRGGEFYVIKEVLNTYVTQDIEEFVEEDAEFVKSHDFLVSVPFDRSFRIISDTWLEGNGSVEGIQTVLKEFKSQWNLKKDEKGNLLELEFEPGIYNRLNDETLTVSELDMILGIEESLWTWERLVSTLKEKGVLPEEVARKLGIEIHRVPKNFASAMDLAKRDSLQFQWWVLSLVNAQPYYRKGMPDSSVDGVILALEKPDVDPQKILVEVRAGNLHSSMIRDLMWAVDREKAIIGLIITMDEPTKEMLKEAASAGLYEVGGKKYPKIQILTIKGLLEGKERPEYFDIRKMAKTSKDAGVTYESNDS